MTYPTFSPSQGPAFPYPESSVVHADVFQADRRYPHALAKTMRMTKRVSLQWPAITESVRDEIMSFFGQQLEGGIGPFYWTPHNKVFSPSGVTPVLSQAAGGSLSSRTYYVRVTWYDAAGGETRQSAQASLAVNANYYMTVEVPPVPSRVDGWRIYAHETSGSECLQATNTTSRSWTESGALSTGTATPPASNTLSVPLVWVLASQEISCTKHAATRWDVSFDIVETLF